MLRVCCLYNNTNILFTFFISPAWCISKSATERKTVFTLDCCFKSKQGAEIGVDCNSLNLNCVITGTKRACISPRSSPGKIAVDLHGWNFAESEMSEYFLPFPKNEKIGRHSRRWSSPEAQATMIWSFEDEPALPVWFQAPDDSVERS